MNKLSTPASSNHSNIDGTTSYEPPICSELRSPATPAVPSDADSTGGDAFEAAPADADGQFTHALRVGLTVGSKVSSGAGFALKVAGTAASPSSYATAAEAAKLLPRSTLLTAAGTVGRLGGVGLSAVAGAVQVYQGHRDHNTKDEVFGALKIGAAALTVVNPPLGLAAGVGIFIGEQVTNHLSARNDE